MTCMLAAHTHAHIMPHVSASKKLVTKFHALEATLACTPSCLHLPTHPEWALGMVSLGMVSTGISLPPPKIKRCKPSTTACKKNVHDDLAVRTKQTGGGGD